MTMPNGALVSPAAPQAGRGRAMAIRGFLCQNIAIGCAFGGFGVTVLPLQDKFEVGRGVATLGLALAVLTMSLFGPVVATLIGRFGLRATMLSGILLSALGYVALAFAPGIAIILAAYALPIGIGLAMFGNFPSSILAAGWFRHNPGPALGFVNTPLLVALLPIASVSLIRDHGLVTFYLAMAAAHLLLLPFAWGIAEAPVPEEPSDEGPGPGIAHHPGPADVSTREILRRPMFWVIAVGSGLLNAVGIFGVTHLVAFGIERAVPPEQAALLASIMGGASVAGSLAIGFICAKVGAARALALIALVMTTGWMVLFGTHVVVLMGLVTLLVGAGGAGVYTAVNVLVGSAFGPRALPRTIALLGLCTLPLTFVLPPLAGTLHDAAGSYDPVVLAIVGCCMAVTALFLLSARASARAVPMLG